MVECSSFTLWDLRAPFCIGWLMRTFSTECGPYWREGSYLKAIVTHHCRGRCSPTPSAFQIIFAGVALGVEASDRGGFYATCL